MRVVALVVLVARFFAAPAVAALEEPPPGVEGTASRDFQAAGMKFAGLVAMNSSVWEFDSAEHAATGFDDLVDAMEQTDDPSFAGLKPTSVDDLGDERSRLRRHGQRRRHERHDGGAAGAKR